MPQNDYTPTTEDVRKGYVYISGEAFDRWLAAHDEEIRVAAFDKAAADLQNSAPITAGD